jgi:hypothetical protein
LIQEGGRTIRSEIQKLINSTCKKEILPEDWNEWIVVPMDMKSDKTDRSNYRGITLLSTTYKLLSNNLLSRLTPYAVGILGDYQCGFRRIRSTADHIFCIRQIPEKKWNTMKQCMSSL